MGTFQRPTRFFLLGIICLSTVLTACSSGGGKGGPAPRAGDTRPEPFTLSAPASIDPEKVAFDTAVVSDAITVTGIDAAAPVSIEDGEYAIDNGEFTDQPGSIRNGQTIRVRVQSPVKAEQSAVATLNIGGETASFTITTDIDSVAPEVTILFPPPASMTEGQTLIVRGTVKDLNGTLAEGSVTVNGVEAELELNDAMDEGSWSVTMDLEPGPNTVTVVAEDISENLNDDASVNTRRVANIADQSFPDNQNPFFSALKVDVGQLNEKLTIFVTDDSSERPGVVAVDLSTGARTVVADNQGVEEALQFEKPQSVLFDEENQRLYVSDFSSAIFELDLQNNTRRSIASAGEDSFLYRPKGMVLRDENKLFVADSKRIYWINTETSEQTLFSSAIESVPDDLNSFEDGVWSLVFKNDRIYVAEWNNKIFSVDPSSGAREVFSDFGFIGGSVVDLVKSDNENELFFLFSGAGSATVYRLNLMSKSNSVLSDSMEPNDVNAIVESWGIASYAGLGYLVLIDRNQKAVMGIDLVTGARVIISKSITLE